VRVIVAAAARPLGRHLELPVFATHESLRRRERFVNGWRRFPGDLLSTYPPSGSSPDFLGFRDDVAFGVGYRDADTRSIV
jgi:hypothetical protein